MAEISWMKRLDPYLRLEAQAGFWTFVRVVALKLMSRLPGYSRTPLAEIRLKYLNHPVRLRLSTSDWAVLDKDRNLGRVVVVPQPP